MIEKDKNYGGIFQERWEYWKCFIIVGLTQYQLQCLFYWLALWVIGMGDPSTDGELSDLSTL